MKKFLILALCSIISVSLMSQVQFNGSLATLKGIGETDNHNFLVGGGLGVRYIFQDKYLFGISARHYDGFAQKYESFSTSDKLTNITASVEYLLISSNEYDDMARSFHPFIGFDAGVNMTDHTVNHYRYKKGFLVAALKVGTYLTLGTTTGLFAQLQYNHVGGDGNPTKTPGVSDDVLTEPMNKYFAADIGFYIRLHQYY